jgi:hypothetical protein
MLELGGFGLEVCIGPNFNIKASNSNIKAYTKFKSEPPNSNIVFLSRFKSHRPKHLAVFLPQQPILALTPGVRPARSHRGYRRGFEMGIRLYKPKSCSFTFKKSLKNILKCKPVGMGNLLTERSR